VKGGAASTSIDIVSMYQSNVAKNKLKWRNGISLISASSRREAVASAKMSLRCFIESPEMAE